MGIDKASLNNARSATLDAANRAKDAGVISPELHARLTDGSISLQDWKDALNVRQNNYTQLIDANVDGTADGTTPGELAQKLFVAVNDQREAQGIPNTLAHTVAELLKP